ncbi:hypothetical protein ACIBM3_15435 [Rhodococcus erythropolis]|uniref:hypothetical protein n=1 Tax=Rhodococcus erythropolis TaxID=1833 RepID=UPI0037AB866F
MAEKALEKDEYGASKPRRLASQYEGAYGRLLLLCDDGLVGHAAGLTQPVALLREAVARAKIGQEVAAELNLRRDALVEPRDRDTIYDARDRVNLARALILAEAYFEEMYRVETRCIVEIASRLSGLVDMSQRCANIGDDWMADRRALASCWMEDQPESSLTAALRDFGTNLHGDGGRAEVVDRLISYVGVVRGLLMSADYFSHKQCAE